MRKAIVPIFIVLFVFCLFSCKQSKVDYEPYISFSAFLRNPVFSSVKQDSIVGCQDSVNLVYDETKNLFLADTLMVNDTVVLLAGFGGRGNDLVSVSVSADTSKLKIWYEMSSDILRVLTDESDPAAGEWVFKGGYNYVMFPVWYVARKAGSSNLVFNVKSDSQYSPVKVTVVQPVKE